MVKGVEYEEPDLSVCSVLVLYSIYPISLFLRVIHVHHLFFLNPSSLPSSLPFPSFLSILSIHQQSITLSLFPSIPLSIHLYLMIDSNN